MSKTRKAYVLKKYRKYEFTKPSNEFAEILDGWGYQGRYWREKPVIVSGLGHPFHADFLLQGIPIIMLEIDGPYHLTAIQMRKSVWRDECLIKAGFVPIHIPVDMMLPICKEVLEANVHQRIERGESLSLKEALMLV